MSVRGGILFEARKLTEGDRNTIYGHPIDNMSNFAGLVSAYLRGRGRTIDLSPEDAAWIMVLSKVARTFSAAPFHRDNYVDAAAYTAMAGECRKDIDEVEYPEPWPGCTEGDLGLPSGES